MATVSTNIINTLGATDLDTKTLTTNLVDAVKAPRQKLIDDVKKKADVAVSTTALLKSALSTLQSASTELGSIGNLNKLNIINSDSSSVSAASGGFGAATPGNYSLEVSALAQAQRTVSAVGFASGSAAFARGFDLNLTVGKTDPTVNPPLVSKSTTITVVDGESVNSLMSKINGKSSETGITARLVNTGSGDRPYKLVLQGPSGSNGVFAATAQMPPGVDPADTATDIFRVDAVNAAPADKLTLQVAQDAAFKLNGIAMVRPTNTINDAVDGLTFQLSRQTVSPVQIDVAYDATQVVSNVSNFVQAFNYVTDIIVRATGPAKSGDDIAGTLQNDSTARSIRNTLRSKLTSPLSYARGNIKSWVEMGVSLDRDGVLQFDQTAFNKKFSSAPQDAIVAISNNASKPYLFSGGDSGLAGDIAVKAYGLLKTGGSIASMTTSYDDKVKKAADQQTKLDAEMTKLSAQYEKQFSALNSVLANFKSTQTRLAAMLNTNNKSN